MKSLTVVRSPSYRRRQSLWFFKSKNKILGEYKDDIHSLNLSPHETLLITTSFSKDRQSAKKLVEELSLDTSNTIVNANFQDQDLPGIQHILNGVDDAYKNVIVILPSIVGSKLVSLLTGEDVVLGFGSVRKMEINISSWNELKFNNTDPANTSSEVPTLSV